jgi:hypothetical protein
LSIYWDKKYKVLKEKEKGGASVLGAKVDVIGVSNAL